MREPSDGPQGGQRGLRSRLSHEKRLPGPRNPANAATAGQGLRPGLKPMLEAAKQLLMPSKRSNVPPFIVMDVMAAAALIEAAGARVVHMEVGQPAASAPATALQAAQNALAH